VIPLSVEELRGLGRLETAAGEVTGVQIDSRRVEPGDLFVAVGRGRDYLDEARAGGAAATLVPARLRRVEGKSGLRLLIHD